MEILGIKMYKDGGTISITTDCGEFCLDGRIGTKTKYQLFDNYPVVGDVRNLIENSTPIQWELYQELKKKPENWNIQLNYTIKVLEGNLKQKIRKEKLKKLSHETKHNR